MIGQDFPEMPQNRAYSFSVLFPFSNRSRDFPKMPQNKIRRFWGSWKKNANVITWQNPSSFAIRGILWNLSYHEKVCERLFFSSNAIFRSLERITFVKWGASSWWSSSLYCLMRNSDRMTAGKVHSTLFASNRVKLAHRIWSDYKNLSCWGHLLWDLDKTYSVSRFLLFYSLRPSASFHFHSS